MHASPILWLLLGGALQVFGFGEWMVPLAAWLAPLFLLHFARNTAPAAGVVSVWLALFFALSLSNYGVIPVPGVAFFAVTALIAAICALPFLADRLLTPTLPGFASTLAFPLAWTTLEFISAHLSPFGSWGALGYTQHGHLPLMQLASVTGVWGISFLVSWFAAVANWAWDRRFDWRSVRTGVLIYTGIWATVMIAGGLRLTWAPEAPTVRVAGIGWPQGIIEPAQFMRTFEPGFADAERQAIRKQFQRLHESFFERSAREVQAGARIIAWPESNLMVLKEDEGAFVERARGFARGHDVYLLAGMATLELGATRPVHNKAVLFDPAGAIAISYTKITAVPGFEARTIIRGTGPIPVAATPYGRLAAAICYDLDFPQIIRQVGRERADLLLVPASDYKAIAHLHLLMAEFRAIENGVALFRITRWGGSGAVDPYGRRLATMNDFATGDNVMVARVPMSAGVRTVYASIGDVFAWLCAGGLLACFAWAVVRHFRLD